MADISRRRFLGHAAIGAAAVGTVAAIGPSILSTVTASGASASPIGTAALTQKHSLTAERGPQPELMAHVVDQSSGTISLYSGTRMVTFQNRAVTDALLKALQ
jgi:Ubiquitinol-cytochrome C reductase Fe-S subunit TAT signal